MINQGFVIGKLIFYNRMRNNGIRYISRHLNYINVLFLSKNKEYTFKVFTAFIVV